jgi:xylan 1,4-beta-xylosidase
MAAPLEAVATGGPQTWRRTTWEETHGQAHPRGHRSRIDVALPNPAVPGFNPDPSVCLVDGEYYLACSSFEYLPGIPIYHSRDLASWRRIGHVAERPGQLDLEDIPTLGGAWAPTIRHRGGRFWLVVTDAMGRGGLIFTAEEAAGPWSDGVVMQGVDGIDQDIAWDADGTAYMTYSGLVLQGEQMGAHHGIQQVRMDLETGRALEAPRAMWSGTGLKFPEAPHLYEIDGTWYLLIAEGGTERGHGVSIARAPRPDGPFESCPRNPVFSARSTSWPVQNAGHGDLVRTPDGGWAIVFLGMRARGMTQAFSPMGRESFITTLEWEDGWPVVAPVDTISGSEPAVVADDFDAPELGLDWMSIRTPAARWSSTRERPGCLVIQGDGSTMDDPRPHFVARRQEHEAARFSVRIDAGHGAGGLSVRMDEDHHYDIEVDGGVARARGRVGPFDQTWEQPIAPGPATITIDVRPTAGAEASPGSAGPGGLAVAPDVVHLSVDTGDGPAELAALDGRYVSAETSASFTGRVVGMYAVRGSVAFERFRYEGRDPEADLAATESSMSGGTA